MRKPTNAAPKAAANRSNSPCNHPAFSLLLALLCGFIAWTVVTVYIDPQGSITVQNVPRLRIRRKVWTLWKSPISKRSM